MVAVDAVLRAVPVVYGLVHAVREQLRLPQPTGTQVQAMGKCIRAMHFLLQDQSQQAEFTWHADDEDIAASGFPASAMTTVIVSLSRERSAMRLWACQPHVYEGMGSAVAFAGAALHETVPRKVPSGYVRKVAFFFA